MSAKEIADELERICQPFYGRGKIDRDREIASGLCITGYDFIEFLDEVERRFDVYLQVISPKLGDPGTAKDVSINDLAEIISGMTSNPSRSI